MKKLIALAVIALALPITVSAASAVKEHQTIPSLLSGRVTVEGQQTTGFAMENPEVWYEEPVEIADNSDSSSNSGSTDYSSSSSGSSETAPESTPVPTPEPTPTPEPAPVETFDCESNCGTVHYTHEEAHACWEAHHQYATCDKCDFQWHVDDTVAMLQHMCQAHGRHLANGVEYICEYCGNTILPDGHVDDSNVVME